MNTSTLKAKMLIDFATIVILGILFYLKGFVKSVSI
jgi:hypothetical protein